MIDRLLTAVVALCLAFLVWLYTWSRDQEILDDVQVPVHLALPSGQALHYQPQTPGPVQVPVSFAGPPARMRELRGMLQRGEIQVHLNVSVPDDRRDDPRYVETMRVEASDIPGPPGVKPMLLEGRNRVTVTLLRIAERRLPVRFDYAHDDRITQAVVEPATVLVRGPQEVLDRARFLDTLPHPLPARAEGTSDATVLLGPVPLAREIDGRAVVPTPAAVAVRVTLAPRQKVYELAEVTVQFLCPPGFPLRPKFIGEGRAGKLALKVLGPVAEEPPAVMAYVDLTRGKFQPGLHEEPLRLQLPKDCQLAQEPPRSVAFELQPADAPPTRGLGVAHGP